MGIKIFPNMLLRLHAYGSAAVQQERDQEKWTVNIKEDCKYSLNWVNHRRTTKLVAEAENTWRNTVWNPGWRCTETPSSSLRHYECQFCVV